MAAQVLSRPYDSVNSLPAGTQLDVELSVTILGMNAEINRRQGATTIFVKTTDLSLKKLEYEFSVVEVDQIEQAIAQELGMPVETVRKLISYRILD